MDELISRQAVIDVIEDFPHGDVWNVESMEEMTDRIKQLPSAEPEPSQVARDIARIVENEQDMRILPKKGKWISLDDFRGKYNENGYKCSECDEHSDYKENFCPNCGARMEGDDE